MNENTNKQPKLTLREWRRVREITQQQAADAAGVHLTTMSKYEDKPGTMPLYVVWKLAELYGVEMDEIFLEPTLSKIEDDAE